MKRKIGPADALYAHVVALEPLSADWRLGAQVEIKEAKEAQTDSQRSYYWVSLHKWGEHLGYSKGESERWLHGAVLNEAFGTRETKTIGHVRIDIPNLRSSQAKRDEYSELIRVLIDLAGDNGFHIEAPK